MPYSANKTINGLEAETTIADTDELVFGDVSDTNRAKKITFANLKTEITGDDTAFVRKADYDANTILYATTDNTPVALTVGTNSVVGRVAGNITTLAVDSDLTSVSTSDDTVPSAKATKTALDLKANDSAVVHNTGNETVAGTKTFSSDVLVPDEAYDATNWNGSLEVPTKNAVRDKIESLATLDLQVCAFPGNGVLTSATLSVSPSNQEPSVAFADGATNTWHALFKVPNGATSISKIEAIYLNQDGGSAKVVRTVWTTSLYNYTNGGSKILDTTATDTDLSTNGTNDTVGIFQAPTDSYNSLTGISAGDIVSVVFSRNAANANDTYNATLYVRALMVTFA